MTVTDARPSAILDPRVRALTIGLVLTITAFAFEALGVATVLPAAVRELGGLRLYGWAFSAFTLADIVGITAAGRWSDRRGPAPPFAVGMVLFAAGLVIGGVATSMAMLVAGRAVQGLGAGAVASVAVISVGRGFDDVGRARMMAVFASAWIVPGLIGPAVAGAVADHLSWRLAFLGILPVLALATLLALPALLRMPTTAAAADGPSPVPDGIRVALGAAAVLGGLGARSLLAVPLIVGGALVALPALRRVLPPGSLTARPGLPAAVATRGLLTFAYFGAQAFVPLALGVVRHQRATVAGIVLTATTVSWTAGAWLQERRGMAIGWHRLIPAGFAAVAVGVIGVASVLLPSVPIFVAGIAWGVAGFGMGVAFSSGTLMTLAAATPGREGATASGLQLADVLGVSLGAGVGGAAVALGAAADWAPRSGIAVGFAACLGAAVLGLVASRNLTAPLPSVGTIGGAEVDGRGVA